MDCMETASQQAIGGSEKIGRYIARMDRETNGRLLTSSWLPSGNLNNTVDNKKKNTFNHGKTITNNKNATEKERKKKIFFFLKKQVKLFGEETVLWV